MSNTRPSEIGTILSLWRYPVKSMIGEELPLIQVESHGLRRDRSYAILDYSDGKVATAKNPRKWPTLFNCKATFHEAMDCSEEECPVHITLYDGTQVSSKHPDLDQILSRALGRPVMLVATENGMVKGVQSSLPTSWTANSEEYWPDIGGRDYRDTVTDFALPTGTFFDAAMVHLVTTATLMQLQDGYPQGAFEIPRFRPNLVIDAVGEKKSFAENAWIGRTLFIGNEVRLRVTSPCARCVMTTLPQGDLPKDPGILRTALEHNGGHVGVYAEVLEIGTIRSGDPVRLEP